LAPAFSSFSPPHRLKMTSFSRVFVCVALVAVCVSVEGANPAWSDADQPVTTKDGLPNPSHANFKAWYKPETLDAAADASQISSWASSQGSIALTGTGTSSKPIVKRNQVNGYHAARFKKSEANYFTSAADTVGASSTVCSVFRVLESSSGGANHQHQFLSLAVTGGGASAGVGYKFDANSALDHKIYITHDKSTYVASSATFNLFDWHIACMVSNTQAAPNHGGTSSHAVYIDGTIDSPIKNAANSIAAAKTANSNLMASTTKVVLGRIAANKEFEGDIAETVVFDVAMSSLEVDRIGTYLAQKFGLQWNRFGGAAASEVSALISVKQAGNSGTVRTGGEGSAAGGAVITITGNELFPADALDNANQAIASKVIKVTIGNVAASCTDPKRTAPCTESSLALPEATDCVVWSLTDADTSGANFKGLAGTIQCRTPAGLGPGADINIHFSGVPYRLNNWYHYQDPEVTSVVPNSFSFSGSTTITINGKNFGPKEAWTKTSAGGATTPMTRTATVEILTRVSVACTQVTWVSDSQLTCKAPAIPKAKLSVDTSARELAASVIVDANGARSKSWASGSLVKYSAVPSYYTCENSGTDTLSRSDCYSCCRHSCVSEEFALGTQKGGATYSFCDSNCISYCGFTSRRRLLSSFIEKMRKILSRS